MSRHRIRLVGVVVLAAAVLSGCAEKKSTEGSGEPVPSVCELTRAIASPTCEQDIQRLNEALGSALDGLLPPDAQIAANAGFSGHQGALSAPSFVPARDQEGAQGYDAPMRVRADGHAVNLEITVHPYSVVPESDGCPDQARLGEMARKGLKQNRCDRHRSGDAVIVVRSESQPYGSDEFAQMALEQMSVVAYRADGVKVDVSQSPVVETVPDDAATRRKATQNFLTLEQLETLALNPALTTG